MYIEFKMNLRSLKTVTLNIVSAPIKTNLILT